MSTFLTTISLIIALGFAIESTWLNVESSVTIELYTEPPGQLPPPPPPTN